MSGNTASALKSGAISTTQILYVDSLFNFSIINYGSLCELPVFMYLGVFLLSSLSFLAKVRSILFLHVKGIPTLYSMHINLFLSFIYLLSCANGRVAL